MRIRLSPTKRMVESLGFRVVRRLNTPEKRYKVEGDEYFPSYTIVPDTLGMTYLVEKDNRQMVIKAPRPSHRRNHAPSVRQIRTENEILGRFGNLEGLPQKLEFFDNLPESPIWAPIHMIGGRMPQRARVPVLVKEYVPGKTLYENWNLTTEGKDILENVVLTLLEAGYASLDFLPKNIVVTPDGRPFFVDVGSALRESEVSSKRFRELRDADFDGMHGLLGYTFKRGKPPQFERYLQMRNRGEIPIRYASQ